MKRKIELVCKECGIEANRLTCLKKHGQEPHVKKHKVSTYHIGICDACKKRKLITQTRDFFYPNFELLKLK